MKTTATSLLALVMAASLPALALAQDSTPDPATDTGGGYVCRYCA